MSKIIPKVNENALEKCLDSHEQIRVMSITEKENQQRSY